MKQRPADPVSDTWTRVWQEHPEPVDLEVFPRFFETLLSLEPVGKRVCEVGCGSGRHSLRLAAAGADVVCVDFCQDALEFVRQGARVGGYPVPTLVAADTLRLPFREGAFDLLFHQGLLEHFRDPLAVVREQARVVRPGGYLLVDVPQRFNWYAVEKRREMRRGTWQMGWETDFTLPGLRRLVRQAGLHPVRAYGWGRYPRLMGTLRQLHEVGRTRFGRPLMPCSLGKLYDRACHRWENSAAAGLTHMNVGVLGRKPERRDG